jgi:hypothetical protein
MKPRSDPKELDALPYRTCQYRITREQGSGALIVQRGCRTWAKGFCWEGRCSPQRYRIADLEEWAVEWGITIDYYDL